MNIEILVFDGCPNSDSAEKLVRETVNELELNANIKMIRVEDNDDAIKKRFLGSPSIRINNNDLEIEENEQTQYSMRCRVYRTGNDVSGVPPKDLLLNKLKKEIV